MKIHSKQSVSRRGFSLIEVILAIGVFAFTIVAVLAMLGSTSQATAEVLNTSTASQIADAIRTELEKLDFDTELVTATTTASAANPVELFGSKDGNRVVLSNNANNNPDPQVADPPGMAPRDRFFRITVAQLGNELAYDQDNANIALSVRLEWPYNVPLGPRSANPMTDPVQMTNPARRSVSIFNVSIPRTF